MSKIILYVGFYALPDKDAAANRVMNNAKALRDAGNTVIFIDEQIDLGFDSIEESLHNIDGFDVWTLKRPSKMKEFLAKMIFIDTIVKVIKHYKKIDIVIAYNYPSIALKKLLVFCHRKNIKLISDCTEWYSGKEYCFPLNILSAMDSFYRMKVVHKELDGIITISSYLDSYYTKHNSLFIPPLVDLAEGKWNYSNDTIQGELNLVYAGRPGKSKENLLSIVEAVNDTNNKNIVLRIAGLTKRQFIELYPGSESKLGKNIIFLGRLSHSENLKVVKSSDFLVFMREKNRVNQAGFSTKFVEAVTLGTAIITTDTGDLKKYIEKYKCGVIVENKDDLTHLLNQNVDQLKRYSEHTILSRTIFDYHEYISKLEGWIENI